MAPALQSKFKGSIMFANHIFLGSDYGHQLTLVIKENKISGFIDHDLFRDYVKADIDFIKSVFKDEADSYLSGTDFKYGFEDNR